MLVGHNIAASQEVEKLINELTNEVDKHNHEITGPRPPTEEGKHKIKSLVDRALAVRGRPLFYPYIGTGAGNGVYVELEDGSVKLDLINGIGIHLMGHGNKNVIKAAIRGALSDIVMQGNLQMNNEHLKLTEYLIKLASRKSRLKYCWLSTCGTIANENAIKMARQKNSPARMIIAMENAFAGRSTMMAELTDNPAYKEGLPEYHEILRLPYYDKQDPKSSEKALARMKEHVSKYEKNIAAFVFEPMIGEGGYRVAPREFWLPMIEFCKERGIAVWLDEVQTFTRTGELFAFETLDLGKYVDLCTIAKTAQLGATLYTEEYNPKPGLVAGTFSGATVSLTAGYEIIRMMVEENYFGPNGKIQNIHNKFIAMLKDLCDGECKGLLKDPEGMGLMIAVTPLDGTKDKVNALLQKMFQNGIMAFSCGKNPVRLRFLVPAVTTEYDIGVVKELLKKSLHEVTKG